MLIYNPDTGQYEEEYDAGGDPITAPPTPTPTPPPPRVPTQNDPDWTPPGPGWTYTDGVGWRYTGAPVPGQQTGPGPGVGGGGSAEEDARNGLVGGYVDPRTGQWVSGEPRSPGGGGSGGGGYRMGGGSYDGSGFAWPQFNAPQYTKGAPFSAPPAFSYEGFTPPTADSIYADPSYKMRRDEGLQAIEHGAAAKGLTRLPATLKSLAGWNQDFASREYGNIFDRGAQTWGMNRNNAADAYSLNYGVSRDVWDRGEQQNLSSFDRNYKGAYDEFDFNSWKPASMTFEDMRARYLAELDATTRIATAGAGG